jgi:glycosyltransferase involved in cell wall biosynthesis
MGIAANSIPTRAGGTRLAGNVKRSLPGQPLVSIVIAVLNGARYLETALGSVFDQTYPNLELLVMDGGSSDGTVELLQRYNDRIDYWISEPDGGVYHAWNKALKLARGEWIAFLGSDDRYLPDAISQYVDYIARHGEGGLEYVSSRIAFLYANGVRRVCGSAWNWPAFSNYMNVAHVGSLHRRSLFERIGGYNPEYRLVGDYELLLRARDTLRAGYLEAVTAEMRAGGICDSSRAIEEALKAKVATAGRPRLAARAECYWALAKFFVRRGLGFVGRAA